MTGRRAVIVSALLVALAAAACSSDGDSTSTSDRYGSSNPTSTTAASTSTTGAPAAAAGPATAQVGDTRLGKVVVDAQGRTLYLFGSDQGTTSSCSASCRQTWAPVVDGGSAARAGTGLDAAKLTTVVQADGVRQVAYNGHLLYTYAGDRAAGDTNGQGVGGVWFAVTAAGDRAS